MLRGVLFDLGGTLQEYKHEDWDAIVDALNRDLYSYLATDARVAKLPPLDAFLESVSTTVQTFRKQSISSLHSHSMYDILGAVFAQHGISDVPASECLVPWYKHLAELTYVRPDVEPTLRFLVDHGLKLGLVSNTTWPASTHDVDLERFGLKDLLACRLYSCEVGWEKPAPHIFMTALDCLNLPAEEVAFVGDFLRYDVAGAQAVGMKGVWKRISSRPEQADDHTVTPDATITSIGELPDALRLLYSWDTASEAGG